MARPKLDINPNTVESLAGINCTTEEIASVIGCAKDVLERRFAANIKKGRENGRSSLRRMMWAKCQEGNITMMIWLSKQILGYTDKLEQVVEGEVKATIEWSEDDGNQNPNAEKDAASKKNKRITKAV